MPVLSAHIARPVNDQAGIVTSGGGMGCTVTVSIGSDEAGVTVTVIDEADVVTGDRLADLCNRAATTAIATVQAGTTGEG